MCQGASATLSEDDSAEEIRVVGHDSVSAYVIINDGDGDFWACQDMPALDTTAAGVQAALSLGNGLHQTKALYFSELRLR